MKASFLWILFGGLFLTAHSKTENKLVHSEMEIITIQADEFGVCRFKLSSTGELSVALINDKTDQKTIVCFGGLCYRSTETDCLPKSAPQKLDIAWYEVQEKQRATLQLISCTDDSVKEIEIELIP